MSERLFPADVPTRGTFGRKGTIRARIDTYTYIVDFFDNVGGTEIAVVPDGTTYARGTFVRAEWANEGGVWIIEGEVGLVASWNFILLAVPTDGVITPASGLVGNTEFGRFAPSPNQIADMHTPDLLTSGFVTGIDGADDSAPNFSIPSGAGDDSVYYWLCQYVADGVATLPTFTTVSGLGTVEIIQSISFDDDQRRLTLLYHQQTVDPPDPSVVSVTFNETQTVRTWGVSLAPNHRFVVDEVDVEHTGEGTSAPAGTWDDSLPWAMIRTRIRFVT